MKKHKAVALRYESGTDPAPRLVAKGRDKTADRIVALARAYDVPLYEDAACIDQFYRVELGEYVPEELYAVAATVLAWVYSMEPHHARQGFFGRVRSPRKEK
ncbi:MAG: hypothetical protein GF333_05130 [Candidatus Omnitrophica bacterium]|nr:hypothetical protein [Candidatus Omnitrophota bacterium]